MILVDSGLVKILFYLTTIVFLVRMHLLPIATAVTTLTDVTRLYTLHPREAFAPSTWHPTHERRRQEIASLLDQADMNDKLYALSPLLWYSLKFTVCHEYGHLLLGHLTSDKKTLRLRPANQVTRARMHSYEPWNRELQADSVAMDLLIEGDKPVEPSVKMARFMGPMFLFHAWHMIEQVQTAKSSDEAGSTHPPIELRMESIRSGIGRELGPYEGERVLGLELDLSALGQLVASSLAEDSGK